MAELVYRAGRHEKRILIPLTPEPRVILEMWCRRAGGVFEVTSKVPEEKPITETYVCRFPTPTKISISGSGRRIGRPERVTVRGIYGSLTLDYIHDVNMMEVEGDIEKPAVCRFKIIQPPRFSFDCNVENVTEVSFEFNRMYKRLKTLVK